MFVTGLQPMGPVVITKGNERRIECGNSIDSKIWSTLYRKGIDCSKSDNICDDNHI